MADKIIESLGNYIGLNGKVLWMTLSDLRSMLLYGIFFVQKMILSAMILSYFPLFPGHNATEIAL